MVDIAGVLQERAKTHGNFYNQACASMDVLNAMERSSNWKHLDPDKREALILIAVKIGRILTGNIYEPDHWADIAGYAKLVADRLEQRRAGQAKASQDAGTYLKMAAIGGEYNQRSPR